MCDFETQKDADDYLKTHPEISRREFTTLASGAGMAMIMPSIAGAQSISERDVEIRTPDGVADCHFAYPSTGSHAAVLVWPDILALRPAFREMGRRLAREGYAVLTVNPFYRDARSPVVGLGASFGQPEIRTGAAYGQNLNADTHFTDARTFTAWLDEQDEVDTSKELVPPATAWVADGDAHRGRRSGRFAAGATFHGGGLATGNPDSPHLLIPETPASMLHCVADNDDQNDPQAK